MALQTQPFGFTGTGQPVTRYTLSGPGCTFSVLDWGAALQRVLVPDRSGKMLDVLLGCDTMEQYQAQDAYMGSFVGRVANRTAGGRFMLDGKEYRLCCNNGPNHLHGGVRGFDQCMFQVMQAAEDHITLALVSPDGDEGYPGRLEIAVCYRLLQNGFSLEWEARSDAPTPAAFTSHAYWNLAGHGSGPVHGHWLRINASRYTPLGPEQVPTGEIAPVAGTPFDFCEAHTIGERIGSPHPQIAIGSGYDHNFVLDGVGSWDRPCVEAWNQASGICMTMYTTLPGVQLYTANFLNARGKGGVAYKAADGFCLEPQYFPNAVNLRGFGQNVVLRPGQTQRHQTRWTFDCPSGIME